MAKTDPIDPNVPAGTEDPKLGDNRIRELARAVAEYLNVDHYIGADGGSGTGYNEDAAGEHLRIKFNAPLAADPSLAANKGFLYTKDVSSKVELFWMDEDGDVLQLTVGGVFNPAIACGLTGNQTIAGIKTFASPIINTAISGSAILDEDAMASDSNVKVATQQSIVAFAKLDANGVFMHDAEGSFNNCDVDGTKTKVYTKYLTGNLDADASTSIAHGLADIDKILSCSVAVYQDGATGPYVVGYQISDHYSNAAPTTARFVFSFDGTNVIIGGVGTLIQGNKYRIKLDYIL